MSSMNYQYAFVVVIHKNAYSLILQILRFQLKGAQALLDLPLGEYKKQKSLRAKICESFYSAKIEVYIMICK